MNRTSTPFHVSIHDRTLGGAHWHGPGATPLVLVHGAGHDHRVFGALLEAMPEVDAWAFDLPGRGASPGPAAPDAAALADLLDGAIDALELTAPPVVLGHSFGGAVALELAFRRPLAALVLLSSGARLRVRPEILALVREVAERGAPRPEGLGAWTAVDSAQRSDQEAVFASIPPASVLADWTAADGFDRMADLSRIEVPTLAVVGSDDLLTPPRYAAFFGEHVPNCTVRVLEGAGHLAVLEDAPRIAETVQTWLRSISPLTATQ